MSQDTADPPHAATARSLQLRIPGWARHAIVVVLLAFITWAALQMEARFRGLDVEMVHVNETPVTLYTSSPDPRPLAVVAHGFGGSRQMMDQISVTLARAGFAVAAFDFAGHGRNPVPLSPDVTQIEGTTAQLVDETVLVTRAMQSRAEVVPGTVLVGHSMATDVIIRAAGELGDVDAVAAISAYSEAITATEPQRLLIVSGAYEPHLRDAAVQAVSQIAAGATEGETVRMGEVQRRAIASPGVGHVGVLYSATTLSEVSAWLTDAVGLPTSALDRSGVLAGLLLAAIVLVAWPLSRFLPTVHQVTYPPEIKAGLSACVLPVPAILAVAYLMPIGVGAYGGFGTLAAAFATWGLAQLVLFARLGILPARPDLVGQGAFLAFGLGFFALALDRYGAAFLPTGPRLGVMGLMLAGTVPVMLADAVLAQRTPLWLRILARASLVLSLGAAMALAPTELGLTFTVLPVLMLFFVVYGSFARWIAVARGPGAAHLGAGVALAWAIAASTPLFATI